MKSTITLLCTVCMALVAVAQTYTGKVQDETQLPVAYAEISAKNTADDKLIKSTTTDEDGVFSLKVDSPESFYIEVSYWSMAPQKFSTEKTNLGTITLKNQSLQLEGVTAVAREKMIEQKADRMVFNVENTVMASGGTVLDVLKKTPGVKVDKDNVSMIGKGGVRVLINDRIVQLSGEDLVAYLSGLPSDDLKSIEVITTPPAKYDAEGDSGFLNIVLKKPRENSWNNQVRGTYSQGMYPTFRFGNTFNYSHNKVHIIASLDGAKAQDGSTEESKITYPNSFWHGNSWGRADNKGISGRLGVDYDITPMATVGVLYSGYVSERDDMTSELTTISNLGKQIGKVDVVGNGEMKYKNHAWNAHYIQKLDTLGRKLSVDVDYFTYNKEQGRIFSNNQTGINALLTKADNQSEQDINNFSIKADMEHPFSWANLSYGAKFTRTKNRSEAQYFDIVTGTPVLDPNRSDAFNYTEDISSLYADIAKSFGKKWQAKAGLRVENTRSRGFSESYNKTNDRDYTKVFPTFYVSYNASENHNLNLNYSRRIRRPAFWELNPFRWYLNANSYAVGNPYLLPEISDNIEFKHSYKNKLITRLFFSYVNDSGLGGQVVRAVPATNQIIFERRNYYKGMRYGISELFLYNPFPWWNTTNQASFYTFDTQYINNVEEFLGEPNNGVLFNFYTNHSFLLNSSGTVSAEATFFYNAPTHLMFANTKSAYSLDLGMKVQLLDKKMQLSVYVNDVLRTDLGRYAFNLNGVKQEFDMYNDTRYVRVGLSYKFGNKKIRVQERDSGNEDEVSRIK